MTRYLVYSFDPDNDACAYGGLGQTMVDVCDAVNRDAACAKIARARGECVTVDCAVPLRQTIRHLTGQSWRSREEVRRDLAELD